MAIAYCIPTLNQLDWVIDKHLPSLPFELFDSIHIIVNECQRYGDVLSMFDKKSPYAPRLIVYPSSENLGVAISWNTFIKNTLNYDGIIIANDDIILGANTIQTMLAEARENPGAVITGRSSTDGNDFSLFYLSRQVHNLIGYFDEQFYPAYFEDNDYMFRMKLLGIPLIKSAGDTYYHKGSTTINAYTPERMQRHHEDFRRNEFLYIQKWGGSPGRETYS